MPRPEATTANRWWREDETPASWLGKCNIGSPRKTHPANCVAWAAARAYCNAVGGDFPTEAEWEYLSRAGSAAAYPWGATFEPTRVVGSVECGERGRRGSTAAVVTAGPRCSFWGICDAIGNVWEWTLTDYSQELGSYVTDVPIEPPRQPVHRGGAWLDNVETLFRSAQRGVNYPTHGLTGVGFRCVRR